MEQRTIKFRAKAECENVWVYGDLLHYTRPRCEKTTIREREGFQLEHDVVEETVCQFAGICDSKGVEIYEGDILDLEITNHFDKKTKHRTRKVVYSDIGFHIVNSHGDCICDRVTTSDVLSYTVIGNLFDNPELMNREP